MKTLFFCCCLNLIAVFVIGCKPFQAPVQSSTPESVHEFTRNKSTIVVSQYENSQSQTLLNIDSSGKMKVLAGQAIIPGFSSSYSPDSTNKVKENPASMELFKYTMDATQFQNRSMQVGFHEALYRLSEAYFNGVVDSAKFILMYDKIIAQPAELLDLEIELQEAKTAAIMAEVEKAKVELQKAQLEFEKMKFERNYSPTTTIPSDSTKETK